MPSTTTHSPAIQRREERPPIAHDSIWRSLPHRLFRRTPREGGRMLHRRYLDEADAEFSALADWPISTAPEPAGMERTGLQAARFADPRRRIIDALVAPVARRGYDSTNVEPVLQTA